VVSKYAVLNNNNEYIYLFVLDDARYWIQDITERRRWLGQADFYLLKNPEFSTFTDIDFEEMRRNP
jgi:hypothetical protein